MKANVLAGKRVEPGDLLVLEYKRGIPTGKVKKAPKRRRGQPVIGVAMTASVACSDGHLVTVAL